MRSAVASCIGAAYASLRTGDGKLAFAALAGVATFSGTPVMAKWVNDRTRWAFSKLFSVKGRAAYSQSGRRG